MQQSNLNRFEVGKPVDFGSIITQSIELFKKVWVEALKHALITLLIMVPLMIVVYLPIFPALMGSLNDGSYEMMPKFGQGMSFMFLIGWGVVVFILAFVLQPLALSIQGNFLKVCKKYDLEEDQRVDGYFDLVKNHFGKLFLLSLATMGIAIAAALLCYLPLFYVMVPLQLLLPVFVFNTSLSVSEIIKASFKLGNKYWLTVFGLIIVSGLLSSVGILLCGIGILVTSFFQYIVIYYFYKDSVGFDETPEITGV